MPHVDTVFSDVKPAVDSGFNQQKKVPFEAVSTDAPVVEETPPERPKEEALLRSAQPKTRVEFEAVAVALGATVTKHVDFFNVVIRFKKGTKVEHQTVTYGVSRLVVEPRDLII